MQKIIVCLSLLLLAASVNATIIDFDSISNKTSGNAELLGDEFSASGVVFSTSGLALNIGATTGSAPNSLGADSSNVNDFDGDITIQFTDDFFVDDLSFLIFNAPFSAAAFDVYGDFLTNISSSGFSDNFNFLGFEVNRVEISGKYYAIDNVSFGTLQSVPEPSAFMLFLLALISLTYYKKKGNNSGPAV